MSTIDVRRLFSYSIATSSINYIRNYNFNSNTVSTIPLSMANSSEEIPLTVNIKTTYPWVSVVDPITGVDKKEPNGNIVLGPSSSSVVLVKIDLPPELESQPNREINDLYISLDIKSGSFPILTAVTSSGVSPKNTIIVENDIYTVDVGETVQVNLTVYDDTGNVDTLSFVEWKSNNMSIAQVEEQQDTGVPTAIAYSPRYIKGISPGTTTIDISSEKNISTSIRVTVREITTNSSSNTDENSSSSDQQRNDRQN